MVLLHAWKSLWQSFPVRKSEWIAAFVLLGCSFILGINPDLFQTLPGYTEMSKFGPQWVWQWGLFIFGLVRIFILGINGAYWRTPHLRALMAFLSCFIWWEIAISLLANLGLSAILAAGYFALDAMNFRQASKEIGIAEGRRSIEHADANK